MIEWNQKRVNDTKQMKNEQGRREGMFVGVTVDSKYIRRKSM